MSFDEKFTPFEKKMAEADLPEIVTESFKHYYCQLVEGETGLIGEDEIEPVDAVPDAEKFSEDFGREGKAVLSQVVMLKLNGGLGTSMGLDKAKSLLSVKKGLSFLDIIARQALANEFPLVLMNSFATRKDTIEALNPYEGLSRELPLDFVQHKVPKVRQSDLRPAEYPEDPDLEWCPPGHGDIYTALITSGMLDKMLEEGYRYAFVSNSDNLGAVLDERILGYFARQDLPFMMEVADRTEADRKGGHIARFSDEHDRLLLRESAQCPKEDEDSFQDIERHRYFNTNNLWISLEDLNRTLDGGRRPIDLPMIRNEKNVNPKDPRSTPVYQLETAMGAAISVFQGAGVVRVPRKRFAPVKTTEDLLVVRSNATVLDEEWQIEPNPERSFDSITVTLDDRYYKIVSEMEERFSEEPPSLKECRELCVEGDVLFERDITLQDSVRFVNTTSTQQVVPAHSVVTGTRRW